MLNEDELMWVDHANKTDKLQQRLERIVSFGDHIKLDPEWHLYDVFCKEWNGCDEAIYYGLRDDETLIVLVEPILRPGKEDLWIGHFLYCAGGIWKPVWDTIEKP
jgi:hypothetical protein